MGNIGAIFKELALLNEESETAKKARKQTDDSKVAWTKEEFTKLKDLLENSGVEYVALSGKGYILVKKNKSGAATTVKLYKTESDRGPVYHISGEMDLKIKNNPKASEDNELENDYIRLSNLAKATAKYVDRMEAKHKDVWDKRREAYYKNRGQKAANKADEEESEVLYFGYINESGNVTDMRDPENPVEMSFNDIDSILEDYSIMDNGDILYGDVNEGATSKEDIERQEEPDRELELPQEDHVYWDHDHKNAYLVVTVYPADDKVAYWTQDNDRKETTIDNFMAKYELSTNPDDYELFDEEIRSK